MSLTIWSIFILVPTIIKGNKEELPIVKITFPSDIADVDFHNSSLAIISNSYPIFDLNCNASYPVEWIPFYEEDDDGTSETKKSAETRRFATDFKNPKTYTYSAILSLQYTGKLQVFTNFSCRSTNNSDLQTNVITTAKQRKTVMFLNIVSNKIDAQKQESLDKNTTKICSVYASVSEMNATASCWRCERANGTELELDFIGCNSPIQCQSNYQRQNRGKQCLKVLEHRNQDEICKRIGVADYNPKMLVCKDFGPALAQFYFFGISQNNETPAMYFDWSEIDPTKMMYIHPIQKELYYGENLTITCEMSRFYFSLGSWFGLLINGEIIYQQTEDDIQDERKGTFISTLNITLTHPSPTKVYCFAPVWNSTEWVNASQELHIQNGEAPKVISVDDDDPTRDDFIVGRRNKSLICKFKGKPKPDVEWQSPKGGYFHIESDLENNISTLVFPEVTFASNGVYTCIVQSFLGSDAMSFTVKATQESSSKIIKSTISIVVILVGVIAIVVGLIVVRLWKIIKSQREALRLLTESEIQEFVEGNPALVSNNEYFDKAFIIEALPYDNKFELSPKNLHIDYDTLLGKGSFGKVYKGNVELGNDSHYVQIKNKDSSTLFEEDSNESLEVAIKTCDANVDVVYFKALLSEIKIMAYIGHNKNIVSLIGACTQNIRNREVYCIVEYCANGSLESYLRRHRDNFINKVQYGMLINGENSVTYTNLENCSSFEESDSRLSTIDLLKWTIDVACGMEFLHEKKVIHGDCAIRNILLSEDLVCKIGDFGLSRQLVDSNYIKKTQCPLPWRHLSPESLRDLEFSVKSDIWAMGVTLWEIYTLSETPYPGVSYNSQFLQELEHGFRLSKPIYATNDLYEFMLKCWKINPSERAELHEIKTLCANLLKILVVETGVSQSQEYLELHELTGTRSDAEGYLMPNPP